MILNFKFHSFPPTFSETKHGNKHKESQREITNLWSSSCLFWIDRISRRFLHGDSSSSSLCPNSSASCPTSICSLCLSNCSTRCVLVGLSAPSSRLLSFLLFFFFLFIVCVSLGFASESAIVENFELGRVWLRFLLLEEKGFWGRVLARDRSKIMSYTSFKRFRHVW